MVELSSNYVSKISLKDVLYVPDLRLNLMSVSKITDNNYNVIFSRNLAIIKNSENNVILKAVKKNGLYHIQNKDRHEANTLQIKEDLNLWHNRYGHLNFKTLKDMIKHEKINGINIRSLNDKKTCEVYIQGKQTSLPFNKNVGNRCTYPLQLIHSDVCGPITPISKGGAKYFVTFTDDTTRWTEVYFMRQKCETLDMFKKFKAMVENISGTSIKSIRTDNGTEYTNRTFSEFLEKTGISHQLTTAYSPQQNGISERKNRTLVEMARSMLIDSDLPKYLWAEALATANYIRNRSASTSLNGETSYFLWKGRKPQVKHFRTFGTQAYVLNKAPGKKKFEPRSEKFYLIGYCNDARAYRLRNKKTGKVIKSRDVVFAHEKKGKCGFI